MAKIKNLTTCSRFTVLSIGLLFAVLLLISIPESVSAQTTYDTTSSLTIPGNSTPYSMNFNTGTIPNDATAVLEIKVTSVGDRDNRDYIKCGSTSLITTYNMVLSPNTSSFNVSTCVRGYDLSTGNRICTTNAWNTGSCAGFFYGLAGGHTVLEYARLTITLAGAPTVTTQAVSSIGATTATGNGNVTALGTTNPTQYGHVWATTQTPTTANSKTELGTKSATGAFTSNLTGLSAGTTYYVRAYATNSSGTSYGSQVSFTTSSTYTLTYTAGSNGSLSGSATQTVSSGGNGSAITAVPDSGYYFVKWSDDVTSNPRTDTSVASNVSVSAIFAPNLTISSIASTTSSTGATATWNTNVGGTSKVAYGLRSALGFESNQVTGPNTSHSITLSSLAPCTRYYFRVVSKDQYNTTSTSSINYFNTTGCEHSSLIGSGSEDRPDRTSGGSVELTNNSSLARLTVPPNYHTASTTFQINRVSASNISGPSGKNIVDENIFKLVGVDDQGNSVTSFSNNLTFVVEYDSSVIDEFEESSLDVYRYNDSTGVWDDKNCTLDTSADTLTCTLSSFSIYGVFGESVTSASTNSTSATLSSSIKRRIDNLVAMGNTKLARDLEQTYKIGQTTQVTAPKVQTEDVPNSNNALTTTNEKSIGYPKNDLYLGSEGNEVKVLQEFLIKKASGPSAQELKRVGATGYFGNYTRYALAEYQKNVGILPAHGYFGPITRNFIESAGGWDE